MTTEFSCDSSVDMTPERVLNCSMTDLSKQVTESHRDRNADAAAPAQPIWESNSSSTSAPEVLIC